VRSAAYFIHAYLFPSDVFHALYRRVLLDEQLDASEMQPVNNLDPDVVFNGRKELEISVDNRDGAVIQANLACFGIC